MVVKSTRCVREETDMKEGEREEIGRLMLFSMNNPKCGLCICLLERAPANCPPDDVVSLCIEQYEEGTPKRQHQVLMTINEAGKAGEALMMGKFLRKIEKRLSRYAKKEK